MDELPAAPIYRGHPDKNMVALMINVSWGKEYIPPILNTLKENNVKATFLWRENGQRKILIMSK